MLLYDPLILLSNTTEIKLKNLPVLCNEVRSAVVDKTLTCTEITVVRVICIILTLAALASSSMQIYIVQTNNTSRL